MMIRQVHPEDAAAIADIYNHYVLETTVSFETSPLSVEAMRARIQQVAAAYPFLVWEEDGHVLGYAYAHQWKERAAYAHTWESTIYLHPAQSGRGMGRRLMQELIPLCRVAGCRCVIACVTQENEASCAFHRALGFVQVSRFPKVGYKLGRWLDVVDFHLAL